MRANRRQAVRTFSELRDQKSGITNEKGQDREGTQQPSQCIHANKSANVSRPRSNESVRRQETNVENEPRGVSVVAMFACT